jgi:hypothetical protein
LKLAQVTIHPSLGDNPSMKRFSDIFPHPILTDHKKTKWLGQTFGSFWLHLLDRTCWLTRYRIARPTVRILASRGWCSLRLSDWKN